MYRSSLSHIDSRSLGLYTVTHADVWPVGLYMPPALFNHIQDAVIRGVAIDLMFSCVPCVVSDSL